MKKYHVLGLMALAALLVAAQGATQEPAAPADDLDDGPHVFWMDDSTAIVLYLCGGELQKYHYIVSDTFEFNGLCRDSSEIYTIAPGPYAIEPFVFDGVSRIMAVSDIHGEFEYFVDLLRQAEVIDASDDWIWGDGHLVVVGDIFDRGDKVTECLWLIHKLERQAKRAGGRVHYLLGNHELMVIQGDNRYVNERYLNGICKKSRIRHEDLFGRHMELGRWVLSMNTVLKINDILFVHAGIAPGLLEQGWSAADINELVRAKIDLTSSQIAFDDTARLLFGSLGPLWYRGYHYEMEDRYPQATTAQIDSILSSYQASAIVVGHTGVDSISSLYDHRVYAVDVPYEDLEALQALLWQDGVFYLVAQDGRIRPIR